MLTYSKAFSGFSVDDLQKAKVFYGNTLGIVVKETMGLELHIANGNHVFIYEKEHHKPATYTVLNFLVNDIQQAMADLKTKGITFENYPEMPTDSDGIFRGGGPLIAWFKDPAGNILSVIEEGSENRM